MNDFSKIDSPVVPPHSQSGVWKIEKKRKARDNKHKQQKYSGKEQKNRKEDFEDDSVRVEINRDRDNDRESKDPQNYKLAKKNKPLRTKVDLKI